MVGALAQLRADAELRLAQERALQPLRVAVDRVGRQVEHRELHAAGDVDADGVRDHRALGRQHAADRQPVADGGRRASAHRAPRSAARSAFAIWARAPASASSHHERYGAGSSRSTNRDRLARLVAEQAPRRRRRTRRARRWPPGRRRPARAPPAPPPAEALHGARQGALRDAHRRAGREAGRGQVGAADPHAADGSKQPDGPVAFGHGSLRRRPRLDRGSRVRAARRGVSRDLHHRAGRPRAGAHRRAGRRTRRGRRRRAHDIARRRADQRRRARRSARRSGRGRSPSTCPWPASTGACSASARSCRATTAEDVERELLLRWDYSDLDPHRPRAARLVRAGGVRGRAGRRSAGRGLAGGRRAAVQRQRAQAPGRARGRSRSTLRPASQRRRSCGSRRARDVAEANGGTAFTPQGHRRPHRGGGRVRHVTIDRGIGGLWLGTSRRDIEGLDREGLRQLRVRPLPRAGGQAGPLLGALRPRRPRRGSSRRHPSAAARTPPRRA